MALCAAGAEPLSFGNQNDFADVKYFAASQTLPDAGGSLSISYRAVHYGLPLIRSAEGQYPSIPRDSHSIGQSSTRGARRRM